MLEGWNEMSFRVPSKKKHSMILWFLNTNDHNGTMITRSGFSSVFQVMNVCLFSLKYFMPSLPRLHLPWPWLHHITQSQPLHDLIILSLFPLSFPIDELHIAENFINSNVYYLTTPRQIKSCFCYSVFNIICYCYGQEKPHNFHQEIPLVSSKSYIVATTRNNRKSKPWPQFRICCLP